MKNNIDAVSDSDTMAIENAPDKNVASEPQRNEGAANYVYIGPSLPGAKLMANAVLYGTRKGISEYCKDVFERYPLAEKLIVPVERLSENRAKVHTSGNVLNKYYNDLLKQVQKGASE